MYYCGVKDLHEQFMMMYFNILAFVNSLSNFNIFPFEQWLAVSIYTILAEMSELPNWEKLYYITRNGQHNRRTIEIAQCAPVYKDNKDNCCLKVHNVLLKLAALILG